MASRVLVLLFSLALLAALFAGARYISKSSLESAPPVEQQEPQSLKVNLYYDNPELDKEDGTIMCSRKGLMPVERTLPHGSGAGEAVALLLRGEITEAERVAGVTSEFPLEGVALKGAELQDGVLTLTFNDLQNRTGGGSCRAGVLWFQIEATAKQFPGVASVRFLPEELFQP